MKTNKKYTVILSAWRTSATLADNLTNTSILSSYIQFGLHLDTVEAVGHYKGDCEISFVIHTNSARTVYHLNNLACKEYKQDCILVRSNNQEVIELHSLYGAEQIGTKFVSGKGDGENYTRLTGGEYWSVA